MKHISKLFRGLDFQSLLLLALAAFMVTIYFKTNNINEQVELIETRLDRMETTILENANLLESHEVSLLVVADTFETLIETDEALLNAILSGNKEVVKLPKK
tara:strand:+ start:1249 stop:1554 length:306 start_codon:yes stop_codon:yes gene_type:complete